MPGLPGSRNDNQHRCSEQNRRKAVTQSYGATAAHAATPAGPPASTSRVRWRPAPFLGRRREAPMRRTLLALLVLFAACQLEPRQATGPSLKVGQVIVVPDTISIDPLGSVQFQAYGRTTSGDSIGVFVQWSATAGSINSDAVYTADTADGDAGIIAQLGGGPDEVPLVSTA